MLSAGYAALPPPLRKMIISNSLASIALWRAGTNAMRAMRAKLPQGVQDTLTRCEEEKGFESREYEVAVEVFYKRHLCLATPWPAPRGGRWR